MAPASWFTGATVTEGLQPMPLVHDISGSLYTHRLSSDGRSCRTPVRSPTTAGSVLMRVRDLPVIAPRCKQYGNHSDVKGLCGSVHVPTSKRPRSAIPGAV